MSSQPLALDTGVSVLAQSLRAAARQSRAVVIGLRPAFSGDTQAAAERAEVVASLLYQARLLAWERAENLRELDRALFDLAAPALARLSGEQVQEESPSPNPQLDRCTDLVALLGELHQEVVCRARGLGGLKDTPGADEDCAPELLFAEVEEQCEQIAAAAEAGAAALSARQEILDLLADLPKAHQVRALLRVAPGHAAGLALLALEALGVEPEGGPKDVGLEES